MPLRSLLSSGSLAKSFNANSFVVIMAMVTERDITYLTISFMASSIARHTIAFKSMSAGNPSRFFESIFTYSDN